MQRHCCGGGRWAGAARGYCDAEEWRSYTSVTRIERHSSSSVAASAATRRLSSLAATAVEKLEVPELLR